MPLDVSSKHIKSQNLQNALKPFSAQAAGRKGLSLTPSLCKTPVFKVMPLSGYRQVGLSGYDVSNILLL